MTFKLGGGGARRIGGQPKIAEPLFGDDDEVYNLQSQFYDGYKHSG